MNKSSGEQAISPSEASAGNAGLDELSLALARQRELETERDEAILERDHAREASLILKGDPIAEAVYRRLREEKEDARRHADGLEGIWKGNVIGWTEKANAAETRQRELEEALRPFVSGAHHTMIFLTSRQKMHPDGQRLFLEDVERAAALLPPKTGGDHE